MKQQIAEKALKDYGIAVEEVRIKRIALPEDNLQSVLDQMIADREKQVTKLLSEGRRDAAKITSEADAKAAEIVANGQTEAAKINAETEKKIAAIYGEAYDANAELFIYLKKLIALENSVSADTVIIMNAEDSAFDAVSATGCAALFSAPQPVRSVSDARIAVSFVYVFMIQIHLSLLSDFSCGRFISDIAFALKRKDKR